MAKRTRIKRVGPKFVSLLEDLQQSQEKALGFKPSEVDTSDRLAKMFRDMEAEIKKTRGGDDFRIL